MATGMGVRSPESDVSSLNLKETELTLGLPGGESRSEKKSGKKRGLSERVDLNVESSGGGESQVIICLDDDQSESEEISVAARSPEPKTRRVIGWPPVKSTRKSMVTMKACKYVKVAVDGAPYLRKVDLEMYNTYQQLLTSLDQMFSCFTIRNYLNERELMDPVNRSEYVPTYQDKDGDWMLVGDVPWKMFVESCKRLRLTKGSEAIGLAPRTHSKCSSSGRQLNKELWAIRTDKVSQHQSRLSTSRVNKGYRDTSTLK